MQKLKVSLSEQIPHQIASKENFDKKYMTHGAIPEDKEKLKKVFIPYL